MEKCQVCDENEIQWHLKDAYTGKIPSYDVCTNCLMFLVNYSLSSKQFFNLLKNGHKVSEHLLHGDFYDEETGEALQPR